MQPVCLFPGGDRPVNMSEDGRPQLPPGRSSAQTWLSVLLNLYLPCPVLPSELQDRYRGIGVDFHWKREALVKRVTKGCMPGLRSGIAGAGPSKTYAVSAPVGIASRPQQSVSRLYRRRLGLIERLNGHESLGPRPVDHMGRGLAKDRETKDLVPANHNDWGTL